MESVDRHTTVREARQIGTLLWLAMISRAHARLPAGDFIDELDQISRQGRIELLHRAGRPVAWFSWDLLAPEHHDRRCHQYADHGAGCEIIRGEQHGGSCCLWWRPWVRPFGCDAELASHIHQWAQHHWPSITAVSWHDPSGGGTEHGTLYINIPIEDIHLYG